MTETAPGLSPGAAAWRRLRRNPLAMGGLVITVVVVVMCAFAPLFSGHDPGYQRHWVGALTPGSSHIDCLRENRLIPGQAPDVSPQDLSAATTITLAADESSYREYRIIPDTEGRIRRIAGSQGELDELVLNQAALARVALIDGSRGRNLAPLSLRRGEAPPVPLFDGSAAVVLEVATEARIASYTAQLNNGVVSAVQRSGTALPEGIVITGDRITGMEADGRSITTWHLLGTDIEGRALFARILYGGRISLLVGAVATLVSLLIGVTYGAVAGYVGGRTDRVLMAGVDVLYGLPFMFLVIVLLSFFGSNILLLFAALGAVQWLTMARIVRGQILGLREADFVAAARLAGTPAHIVILRHLVPNSFGPIVVYASLTVPIVILEESFLAFIGLSASFGDGQVHSWGALVKTGVDSLGSDGSFAWLLLWPSLVMAATLIALNVLGDGIRDALDPKLSRGAA
ncbi:MAG: ABC transporter permease [Planctomycetota bacterium]|jgi:oligopeptide transport system permease protein|nr:ABC transporter permease [Planctomycetota bacterium]